MATLDDIKNANKEHKDISHSTYMNPYTKCVNDIIHWGMVKLGWPLQQVELTQEQMEICLADALEKYTKFATFQTEDIVVSLKGYDPKNGLDLSEYNIADIHDISFRRDCLFQQWGCDIFFGPYGMMNSYAGSGIFPGFNGAGISNQGWISLHNLHENLEMIHRMTGSAPQWRYLKSTKSLKIIPAPKGPARENDVILITCEIEPPPEELFGNEYVKRLFLAYLKIQLGIVRKKFSSVQLIGGGQIDTSIGDEGKEELDKCMEDLRSSESFGNICIIG